MPTANLQDTPGDGPDEDPPPPYPSRHRRTRRPPIHDPQSCPEEDTPLLPPPSPRSSTRTRPRTVSTTTSASTAPSVAQTLLSLFQTDQDSNDIEIAHDDLVPPVEDGLTRIPSRSNWLSKRAWKLYLRPLTHRTYYAALFHLLFINFFYALLAFVYLFVLTLTGTTLLLALPLGALLCFLNLLGARAFARGELALQTYFHHPLAFPPPEPPHPIFTRLREPGAQPMFDHELASSNDPSSHPLYERSFYKNTYSMFTDPMSYQALFYFVIIKPPITLVLFLLLVVSVPPAFVLVLPAPAVLRAARKLGIWQANVAVEGLYYTIR